MKKTLLNKLFKSASVALLAGVMVCGASLTSVNAAKVNKTATYEEAGIKNGKYNRNDLGAVRQLSHKAAKKSNVKTANKARKTLKHNKKSVKKVANKRTRKNVKKSVKKNYRKANRKSVKRTRKLIRRHNIYRHLKKHVNYRKGSYYRRVWSNAKKFNQKKMNFDLKQAKKDQKAGYKKAAKNALASAHKLNWWINHDAHMLSLAK